jgi:ABC-2 type transport system permease protein
MRLWAEERKAGTIEFLFTQPVPVAQAVIGKFLAAWLFVAVAFCSRRPRDRRRLARKSRPLRDRNGLPGRLPVGRRLPGRQLFCSALTRSQIVSFVLSIGMIGLMTYTDSPPY